MNKQRSEQAREQSDLAVDMPVVVVKSPYLGTPVGTQGHIVRCFGKNWGIGISALYEIDSGENRLFRRLELKEQEDE